MGQVSLPYHQALQGRNVFRCRTAKVWKNFELAYDLKGHGQSVWAVVAIDEDRFLTGTQYLPLISSSLMRCDMQDRPTKLSNFGNSTRSCIHTKDIETLCVA
jgi:hypothetical protein